MNASRTRSTFFRLLRLGLAGLSAVLCIACLVGWILSHLLPPDEIGFSMFLEGIPRKFLLHYEAFQANPERVQLVSGWSVTIFLYPGAFGVELHTVIEELPEIIVPLELLPSGNWLPDFPGVFYCRKSVLPTDVGVFAISGVEFYLWLPTLLFAIYPVIVFRRVLRRRRRLRRGDCLTCGYSLAGNVSGICPECGGQI